MKILLISQARISSSRLPGKVVKSLGKSTVLGLHLARLKKSKLVTDFLVATVEEPGVEKIVEIAQAQNFNVFKGSLNDVLDRFYQAALPFKPDAVVRVTSDCPLIDAFFVDDLIQKFQTANVDYASNCLVPTLPDGMDCEVFKFSALEKAWKEAALSSEREHVTPFIWKNSDVKGGHLFKALALQYSPNLSHVRLTLDQQEDYNLLRELVRRCGEDATFEMIMNELNLNPELMAGNSHIQMNEGYLKSVQGDSKK